MKIVFLVILSVIGCESAFAQDYYGGGGGYSNWQPKPGMVQFYNDLKPTSLRILSEAFDKTHNPVYSNLYQTLSSADIADGQPEYCGQGAVAYSFAMSSTIFVCDEYGDDYGIRVLIHETVHLTGNMDECDADRLSGMAEIDSGEGISAPGAYDDRCPDHP